MAPTVDHYIRTITRVATPTVRSAPLFCRPLQRTAATGSPCRLISRYCVELKASLEAFPAPWIYEARPAEIHAARDDRTAGQGGFARAGASFRRLGRRFAPTREKCLERDELALDTANGDGFRKEPFRRSHPNSEWQRGAAPGAGFRPTSLQPPSGRSCSRGGMWRSNAQKSAS